jgi:hypothetical protein
MVQLKDQKYTEEISCGRAVSNVGNLPSRTTTGGLGEDTLQTIMDFVPSLTLFEAAYNAPPGPFPPTEPPEVLQFLNVQTFVNGANALNHCWTTADCSLFRFGPHQSWYHLHVRLDPKLYLPEDGAIEHGYNFSPYNVPEHVDPYSSVVVSSTVLLGLSSSPIIEDGSYHSSFSNTFTRRSMLRGCQREASGVCPCRRMCGKCWTVGTLRWKALSSARTIKPQLRRYASVGDMLAQASALLIISVHQWDRKASIFGNCILDVECSLGSNPRRSGSRTARIGYENQGQRIVMEVKPQPLCSVG